MNVLNTLATGVFLGLIDILPMIKMKLDKHSILSAFMFYLIAPFIVYSTGLFGDLWHLKGSLTLLMLSAPIDILIAKDGIKAMAPVIMMSLALGFVMGALGHFLWKVI